MKLSITTAIKTDKKSLMRFYKQQHYSAGLLGFDNVYVIKHEEVIIAAVIVSALEKDNPQLFLHALVVDDKFRQQGLASKLLKHIRSIHSSQEVICFASIELSKFYQKSGFELCQEKQLCPPLLSRYLQYKKTNNELLVFNQKINVDEKIKR